MKSLPPTTCRLILGTALACAALPIAARAQASASARLENNLSGSSHVGVIATPTNTGPTHQEAGIEQSANDGTIVVRGYGVDGVVGAYSQIRFATANSNSGGLLATASGGWNDIIDLVIPNQFVLPNVSFFLLDYNAEAHGGVAATADFDDNGFGLVGGSAAISYDFSFGNSRFIGTQNDNPLGGGSSITGTWGTLAGTAAVAVGESVRLSMSGSATTAMGNFFNFGSRTASADADFGSTLIWGGITHVTAFNVSGQEIALPDDFQLDLIGRQSGFNYWYAAEHPDAPAGVPDSTPAMLLLAPTLFSLALLHRRHQHVKFGP